ncbi:hypothetical protein GCM10010412_097440 [Nonomuraea recticatena]|uniref:Uncharacterized protein n=1 Tax=Nonomuraea recticatena TaxID=46178 RepID=A0ABN3TE82_9ACTN
MLIQMRCAAGEQGDGLPNVAPYGGGADGEARRQLDERLALAQWTNVSMACWPGLSRRQREPIFLQCRRMMPDRNVNVRRDNGSAAR